MKFLKKFWPESEFLRNVLKLFSSTVAAGIINAIALWGIQQLYPPGVYGDFQLILSVVIILGMIASLKYELAIVLPEEAADKDNLVVISFLLLFLFTAFSAIIIAIFGEQALGWITPSRNAADYQHLKAYLFLIPLGVFFTGLLQVCRYILIRHKAFGELAKNKVYQVSAQHSVALGWGFYRTSFEGIFSGYIVGTMITAWLVLKKRFFTLQHFSKANIRKLLRIYKKFPIYNTPSVFLNNFSMYLPIFMVSSFFDKTLLGIYAIANQYAVMPINLVGTSVSQVYYQAAAELYNKDAKSLMGIYLQTIKKVALIGLAPILAIAIFAPGLSKIFFTAEWADVGIYMQILSLGIYFRFLNIPIGTTFSIINKQEIALYLIIFSLTIRYGAMYLFRHDIIEMLWGLSISTAIFYASYNFMVYWYIRKAVRMQEQAEAGN